MKGLSSTLKGNLPLILVVLVLLVWMGGEAFGLDKKIRLLVTSGVVVVGVVAIIVQKAAAAKGALAIEEKLKAQAQEQVDGARPDQKAQVQAVEQQLNEAIGALKNSRLGKSALYTLPWYMIIGPPGSGKSTALQESGLNFPYVSQGRKGVRGVGGTRNCDWWFTDEGILLDTAGRYTTEIDDRDEWMGFLELLKNARKHKPINGAIVAIAVSDLLSATEEEIEAHAKNIRERLDELTNRLEIVFPVYLLFTKCDLLQGFVEFFEDFAKADRAQVWGCSMPYAPSGGKSYRDIFEEETGKLFRSLSAQRLASLAAERPAAKKQNIFVFPLQFQAATKKLADLVGALFRPNPFQETSVFRGFYFTSGTQEGTPIDQVIRSMSAAFGLQEESASMGQSPGDKKSYFLNHLFTKIIFPDQTLARTSARVQKRRTLLHYGTLGLSAVASVAIILGLLTSFFGNRGTISDASAAAQKVREADKASPANTTALVEAMDGLRKELERLEGYDQKGPPMTMRMGLHRSGAVLPTARKVYLDALKRHVLTPTAERMKKELEVLYKKESKAGEDYDKLFDLYRVYQMIGGQLPAEKDKDVFEGVLQQDGRWYEGLGGKASPLADAQLKFFGSQLTHREEWAAPTDRMLINRIKDDLGTAYFIYQSYKEIIDSNKGAFGKVTGDSIVKARGKEFLKFNYEFSSLFTQQGWNEYVHSAIKSKSELLAAKYAELKIQRTAQQVEAELREKHVERYAREWDTFLKSVELVPFQNLEDAANKLKILAGDQSPYIDLVKGVWEGQILKLGDEVKTPPDLKSFNEARNAIYEFQQVVEEFVASTQAGTRVAGGLREGKIRPLLEAFTKVVRGLDAGVRLADPKNQEGLRRLLYPLIDHTRQALASEAQKEANDTWEQKVHRLYKDAVAGRYPFDETAAAGASVAGVTQLLNAQSGVFWSTYTDLKRLNELLLEGKPLVAFSREFNAAVRKAEAIRGGLFRGAGDRINVPFKVTLKQRTGVTHVKFTLGKKEFNHNDRPDNRGELVWEGEAEAALSIRVVEVNRWYPKEFKDDWGLLRLIASGNPQPADDKSFACTWEYSITHFGTEQKFNADVLLEADTKINPFQKDFFTKFLVPEKVGP
jgi:type VI secretion system protein ImpL